MMFKNEMAALIRQRKKWETRRLVTNKRIYKVGSIQPIQENYFDKAKDHVKILATWTEQLQDMKQENVTAEGFTTWPEYMAYLQKIDGKKATITPDLEVRAYRFEYIPPKPKVIILDDNPFSIACYLEEYGDKTKGEN